jgi:hypothetical protein
MTPLGNLAFEKTWTGSQQSQTILWAIGWALVVCKRILAEPFADPLYVLRYGAPQFDGKALELVALSCHQQFGQGTDAIFKTIGTWHRVAVLYYSRQ